MQARAKVIVTDFYIITRLFLRHYNKFFSFKLRLMQNVGIQLIRRRERLNTRNVGAMRKTSRHWSAITNIYLENFVITIGRLCW